MKTFKIITFGCKVNQYESQLYHDQLVSIGYIPTETINPTIIIINCCAITQKASKEVKNKILSLLKENKNTPQIFITGCVDKNILPQDEKITIVTNEEKEKLLFSLHPHLNDKIKGFQHHTRAFVKIQDGCNSFCAYCIVPFMRGRSRIRSFNIIIEEIKGLANNGYKEIVLTGINVGDYHELPQLISSINNINGIERIRLSSINVDHINDALIDGFINNKKFMPSLHLPLQSGSNTILKKMNRKYTVEDYLDVIDKFKAYPHFTFTTDIIVGFPNENEDDFLSSIDVIKKVGFIKVHVFPFSKRENTLADQMPNQIPNEIIKKRKKELTTIAEDVAFKIRNKFVGQQLTILMESKGYGYSENYLPIYGLKGVKNQLIKAKVVHNSKKGLLAESLCQ
jgi:threonylcarbamoyladenosine tRNA methylthiotransferase MtaB